MLRRGGLQHAAQVLGCPASPQLSQGRQRAGRELAARSAWTRQRRAAPEVGKIRLVHFPAICVAPGYLAEELLHAEGFEQVEYVKVDVNTSSPTIASGQVDQARDARFPQGRGYVCDSTGTRCAPHG